MTFKLRGLVAATHTPFDSNSTLNLAAVERQADHLARSGVDTVFIAGSTGESHSLTVDERLALARRWKEVIRGTKFKLVIHVGSNCLVDSRTLAAQAQSIGADAIAALSPSYFKPKSVEALVACCAEVASAAPGLPFYFYDIPILTGVQLPTSEFLVQASERIPNLAGAKFTNPDLMAFQTCLHLKGGQFDVAWGLDEYLLAALSLGAKGAVGSTYNFAAPIYNRVIAAFERGDLAAARAEQFRSVQLIELLIRYGFIAATKVVMGFLGVDVGNARLPHLHLSSEQSAKLREGLDQLGFFEWIGR
jgi:N-acetylneuraminate lyase